MTDHPYGEFAPTGYQALIRVEADRFLAGLAAADIAAPVPACPDWTVRDLAEHLGRIHQWARLNATSGLDSTSPDHPTTGPGEGEPLASWYAGCVDELLKALATTDPAQPCWTFQRGNRVARFWSRRQSHELAMHRNDLDAARGLGYRYDPAHAVDGIGEVLDVFLERRKVYGVPPLDVPAPLLIECTDRPARWLLVPALSGAGTLRNRPAPGDREATDLAAEPGEPTEHHAEGPAVAEAVAATAAATVRGSAAGLLLAMWKRQDATVAGLSADGDISLVDRFLAAKLTP